MTDDIELPPLHYDEMPEYGDAIPAMHAYARRAIKADRQQREEPVAKEIERQVYHNTSEHKSYLSARFDRSGSNSRVSFEWEGHRWAYLYTHFDDCGEYDLIVRPLPAPQPAAPQPTKPTPSFPYRSHARKIFESLEKSPIKTPQPAAPAQEPTVPEGWKLVPVEPTENMLEGIRTGSRKDWPSDELCRVRYVAMLAATPKFGEEE